jgi:vacuolar-type H+-ATPase subunit B/Vma2
MEVELVKQALAEKEKKMIEMKAEFSERLVELRNAKRRVRVLEECVDRMRSVLDDVSRD